jgi:hypothetical protein
VAYALENALFQWEEGERRLRDAPDLERRDLERAADVVLEQLRRRLGGSFTVEELADLYAGGVDRELALAGAEAAGADAAFVVDAAFNRYAAEAANYAGGRPREGYSRP